MKRNFFKLRILRWSCFIIAIALLIPWEHSEHYSYYAQTNQHLAWYEWLPEHLIKDTFPYNLAKLFSYEGIPPFFAYVLYIGVSLGLLWRWFYLGQIIKGKKAFKEKEGSFITRFIMKLPRQ